MATFAKKSFNAAAYALSRPTYPRTLFEAVLAYHETSLGLAGTKARWGHALDLGCGTGQATAELLRPADGESFGFSRVTGVEPGEKMIREARAFAASLGERGKALSFVQGPAENLGFVPDQSVDLVVAAQAAHWFDWERLWPELSRVLRHGGTVALWVYSEMRLPQFPQLTPIITEYLQGTDPKTSLGPHWEPGRRILNNHLLDISTPTQGWDDLTRVFFTGDYYPDLPEPQLEPILSKKTTWGGGLHGYLRTFSSLHRFHEAFPQDLEHPDGDIASRFLRALMTSANVPLTEEGLAQEVEIEWPLALVLARKDLDQNDPWRVRDQALIGKIDTVREPYDTKMAGAPTPTTVEETSARMDEWITVQRSVLGMIDAEVESLPPVHEEAAAAIEELEESEEERELTPMEEFEAGRARYLEMLDNRRTSLTWRLSFKDSFEFALKLAEQVEAEVPKEQGVQLWMTRMREHINKLKEGLPDVETPEELDFESLERFSEDDMARFEVAQSYEGILNIIEELVEEDGGEPIGKLVQELYISAATEVTSEVAVEA
ncbi:S-adenosyl-L-methionine-dependent methyltransferase [Mycena chlorophos]|uniref:S-adenosyl-L-methionine-dependent methyltransferase n=1 Tax=Mycena chlorophos TaxID=658473 RepID=A0A8H6WDJ2_MYCCL|nr:S-adenosyl-L-methionine-dependent methyltransferase [Mycena chlorophos]